ncbi:Lrp/AsnC family transcriptional regulator [Umboniibacter marinipuniceus]|uniref:AsnC family transcriptional regulator n=1 Tax=Umboniibacter marinipuniceus TaxID=569599 RepID=A0A3M0A4D7_9GAMM|nr:Lrp/AsnC family transcriptional regulator [Umboniibacter marinipuniceus]RMA77638.1 AsnC family transcriptional regulator [Umboniibacter marinipuniceus]
MLDRLDLRILSLIQANGRLANKELAELVNLSPSACHQRFQRLQAEGWIKSFSAEVDVERLCSPVQCIASVSLSNHSPDTFRVLEEQVAATAEALDAYTVSGNCDFIIRFACANMTRYMELTSQLIDRCPEINNISTHVIMRESKRFSGYPLAELVANPLSR